VINNAGYGYLSSIEDATEEAMKKQFDINVFSIFRVCKIAIPYLKQEEKSLIINIGSYFGKVAFPMFSFYSASKFAVEGLTDAMKFELKELGIRVHSVVPGFTKSNFTNSDLIKNCDTFDKSSSYKNSLETTPKLLENIKNGSDPQIVAQTILRTINNDDLEETRVYVEGDNTNILPLQDELSEDKHLMHRFFKLEIEDHEIDKASLKIAMDAKEILLKDFVNPPKMAYLAQLCATNKTTLNLAFQDVYNMTISAYIKKLRLQKAHRLLRRGEMRIGEVAKAVGYGHQGNFSKLFVEKYGISPKNLLCQKC